jgi:hypothetical protein
VHDALLRIPLVLTGSTCFVSEKISRMKTADVALFSVLVFRK